MTVPFDEQTLTWRTDGKENKPLGNIASNVYRMRLKEVLVDCIHRKEGLFTTGPGLTYFSLTIQKKRLQATSIKDGRVYVVPRIQQQQYSPN